MTEGRTEETTADWTESWDADGEDREDGQDRDDAAGATFAARPDLLYGAVRLSWWAAALVATPPFVRLAGISLSDVPGEWLFGHLFPSRLDHTLGVYHLARLARPRDRLLQAAALAHDLGHGPFSHLGEPLMRERLGMGHEARSAHLLAQVRAALSPTLVRRLDWLDWDEVAALVRGEGADGRGALLNGRLDYDNADNVARFLLAGDLGAPGYDPRELTRALRLVHPAPSGTRAPASLSSDGTAPLQSRRHDSAGTSPVYLAAEARGQAQAWQADRQTVYTYLHAGHRNLALHAMLRKAVDLAALADLLPPAFFDLTDAQAIAHMRAVPDIGIVTLIEAAAENRLYQCVWEAEAPAADAGTSGEGDMTGVAGVGGWRGRLRLEARLAAEAGLAEHEVIVESIVSSARRGLPPLAPPGRPGQLVWLPDPPPAPRTLHVFAAPGAPRDYLYRLRLAVERHFGALGIMGRPASLLPAP
jgi:HD superfamily phosphohydrolase